MICNCRQSNQARSPKELLQLAQKYKVGKLADGQSLTIVPFNMVLEPFCISSHQYQKLKRYSYLWQKITHLASMDKKLILESLSNLKKDPMIGPMIKIYQKMIQAENKAGSRKPQIQLFRSDFFITNDQKNSIKIIQYNNMSVSMAGISQQFQKSQKQFWGQRKLIIQNKCTQTYAKSIIDFYSKSQLQGIFLTVVKNKEINVIDQDLLLEQVKKHSNICVEKVLLEELNSQTGLSQNNDLMYKQKKVAIVYYRAGYSSHENIDWNAIQKCNLSTAVNIPSINSFLIGSKKMQGELSKKNIMKRYLTEKEADQLLQSVIDTWDFDAPQSKQKILELIQKQGINNFVLKPNEEGGKNNFFGEDAYNKIKQLSDEDLLGYILTRRIQSRKQKCTLICSKKWNQPVSQCCSIQSQTSIYGSVYSQCNCLQFNQQLGVCECKCSQNGCCLKNCCEGYLVRSKPEGVNQGGLMAGTGAICGLQLKQQN